LSVISKGRGPLKSRSPKWTKTAERIVAVTVASGWVKIATR
jgi:hypothetical protein